jgi:hypothetical protein
MQNCVQPPESEDDLELICQHGGKRSEPPTYSERTTIRTHYSISKGMWTVLKSLTVYFARLITIIFIAWYQCRFTKPQVKDYMSHNWKLNIMTPLFNTSCRPKCTLKVGTTPWMTPAPHACMQSQTIAIACVYIFLDRGSKYHMYACRPANLGSRFSVRHINHIYIETYSPINCCSVLDNTFERYHHDTHAVVIG